MSPYDLDDYALQLEGIPMVPAIVSIFFVLGLLLMLAKKSQA